MSSDEDSPAQHPNTSRPGSPSDLSWRMNRMETKYDDLAAEVASLTGTVARVEQNQTHTAELNKLRFDALDSHIQNVGTTLEAFIKRIDGIISGEIRTAQTTQGEKVIGDYMVWKDATDKRLDAQDVMNGQVKLLGRLAVLLVSTNVIAIIVAIVAAVNAIQK